ncbi:MAG: class I SAM-dependent methyltransferase [Verrucomicrobiae bacterium]|nr:class I SAM-dependent methyltransferase [Verrucomicrobiae bacterium]
MTNQRIGSRGEFEGFFEAFFGEAGVGAESRGYFRQSSDRLWDTATAFGLWEARYGSVLEIGPGFAYLPFLWKRVLSDEVAILDGESEELIAFGETYRRYGIEPVYADLFRLFGERDPGKNRLPFETGRFEAVICWETMEHFNFNPIPFLKELRRVTRPGGQVLLTVPNQAKLDMRLALLRGRSVRTPVGDYVLQMDDANRMKYAPHWREYTLTEFRELIEGVGFRIGMARHLQTYMNREGMGLGRRIKRGVGNVLTRLVPSLGALCVVRATVEP